MFCGNCVALSSIRNGVGVPLVFSLGYVKYNIQNIFYSDTRELKAMLHKGMSSHVLNLHACPSVEARLIPYASARIAPWPSPPNSVAASNCAQALSATASLCQTRGHSSITVEHWLLKLLEQGEGDLTLIARRYEWDLDSLWQGLLDHIDSLPRSVRDKPRLSPKL